MKVEIMKNKNFLNYLLIKLFLILTITTTASAEPSMRRCMILPIKDSVGGAIGFKVFNRVERYLKASKWCYYRSNSEIINILSNYKNSLDKALGNPQVLKIVADKTKAGSLIKVDLESMAKGMRVNVDVIGPNGKDSYFSQSTEINTDEIGVIAQTINNWLDVYEKNIPYDARVVGVLGQQFTIDIGEQAGIYNDYTVNVVRPVKKQKHPLLKEIVEWKTMPVAEAKIFHVGKSQSQVKVVKYKRETLIQPEDWIIISKTNSNQTIEKLKYTPMRDDKSDQFSFGKLGQVGLFLNVGSGSHSNSGGTLKKLGGFTGGIGLSGEIWATRNYWLSMNIDKHFGSYSQKEGTFQNDSNSLSYSAFKLKAGYKYLPLGFFYGPQVDGYVGYASYSYGFDTQSSDEITAVKFKGLMLGARGSMPLIKDVRIYMLLDFIFKPGYSEEITIMGEADSTSNFNLELGGNYKYSPNMYFDGSIGYISSRAKFASPDREVSLKNTNFKLGAKFNF